MKKLIYAIFVSCLTATAMAGEHGPSARLYNLARQSEKVFVGKVQASDCQDGIKIVQLQVLENLKGTQASEAVRLFVFDRMVHSGDPTLFPPGQSFLFYLRACPNKAPYSQHGPGLFMPSAGEASIIELDGVHGDALRTIARRDLNAYDATIAELEQELESTSPRIRANALACIATMPENALRVEAPKLMALLQREGNSGLGADALAILAQIAEPGTLPSLVDFAIEHEKSAEMLPLVAHALNQIDPAAAVREIEGKSIEAADSTKETRAARLLSRIDAPEALGELLIRAKRNRNPEISRSFSAATFGEENRSLQSLVAVGSLEEKKAAAFSMLRWGQSGDLAWLQEQSERHQDITFRHFLKRMLKNPHLSFAEVSGN